MLFRSLLLRYGLIMEFPNPQNILVELDGNLWPTGRIVFRDLSDTVLLKSYARALGEGKTLVDDADRNVQNADNFIVDYENSFWGFKNAKQDWLSTETLRSWASTHNGAFYREIEEAMGIQFPRREPKIIAAFFSSPQGKEAIRKYRQKLLDEKVHK